MVMTNWASKSRRTWTRLAIRGENQRVCAGGLNLSLGDGVHEGATPEETDWRQVPVQPRPETALVVAQPQELLAILVEPLDGPATARDLELAFQGKVVQVPGELPARLLLLPRQGPLSKKPALRTDLVTHSAMGSDPTRLLADEMPLPIDHLHRGPSPRRHRAGQLLRCMQRRHLGRVGVFARSRVRA